MWCLGASRELHLLGSLLEPFLDSLLGIRGPGSEPLFQNLWAGRRQEEEAGLGKGRVVGYLFDALLKLVNSSSLLFSHLRSKSKWESTQTETHLHFNIQNAHPSPLRNIFYGLDARPIAVAAKLRMLDEPLLLHQFLEFLGRDKVVFAALLLARAGLARRVRDAEAEAVGVLGEEAVQDGGFACARGAGDYDGAVGVEGFCEVGGSHVG